ncbi:O-antigen ligase [Acidobacterium sp. S8]|uniref:O-antigen ligase family protein n=1 Tax=Acidobacterium sp. S8 TaxID=1641854 RepID=UPI00131E7B17|nr:O-antigen ligase family protein [Acidobacterium sp. S8]
MYYEPVSVEGDTCEGPVNTTYLSGKHGAESVSGIHELRSDVFLGIRLTVLFCLPFILADAAFYQLQILATGGSTPVSTVVFKITLLLALSAAALLRGRIRNPRLSKFALVFVAYLIIAALYQYFVLDVEVTDILISYNTFYLLPILNVLALSIPLNISDRLIMRLLLALFIICAWLGFAQYVTQQPIVATSSSDGYFQVRIWHNPNGGVKAFSLFLYPERFGGFATIIACLALAMCARRRKLLVALPLLVLSVLACWISTARADLVGLVCALTTSVVLTFGKRSGRTKWLPFAFLLIGLLVGIYAYSNSMSGGNNLSITDTSSFTERLNEWKYYLSMFSADHWSNALFGFGISQSERLNANSVVAIDNIYLATILHIGIVGLMILMAILWRLWEEIRKRAESEKNILISAVAAYYSTLLCVGLFTQAVAAATAALLLFTLSAGTVSLLKTHGSGVQS